MCNRTQNDAIWGLIALFLTNQIAGNTIDFKMNVINSFINVYQSVLDNHIPIRNIIIKPRPTPFVDNEIKSAIRVRDKLHQYYYQSRNLTDWSNYKIARNTVKSKLRNSEKHYANNQISKCQNNPGALWKVINQTLPRKEKSHLNTKNTQSLAEEFNIYFSTVGEKTVQSMKQLAINYNIPLYTINQIPTTSERQEIVPFDFVTVTADEIKRRIMSLPNNKSPGPDKISMRTYNKRLVISYLDSPHQHHK